MGRIGPPQLAISIAAVLTILVVLSACDSGSDTALDPSFGRMLPACEAIGVKLKTRGEGTFSRGTHYEKYGLVNHRRTCESGDARFHVTIHVFDSLAHAEGWMIDRSALSGILHRDARTLSRFGSPDELITYVGFGPPLLGLVFRENEIAVTIEATDGSREFDRKYFDLVSGNTSDNHLIREMLRVANLLSATLAE